MTSVEQEDKQTTKKININGFGCHVPIAFCSLSPSDKQLIESLTFQLAPHDAEGEEVARAIEDDLHELETNILISANVKGSLKSVCSTLRVVMPKLLQHTATGCHLGLERNMDHAERDISNKDNGDNCVINKDNGEKSVINKDQVSNKDNGEKGVKNKDNGDKSVKNKDSASNKDNGEQNVGKMDHEESGSNSSPIDWDTTAKQLAAETLQQYNLWKWCQWDNGVQWIAKAMRVSLRDAQELHSVGELMRFINRRCQSVQCGALAQDGTFDKFCMFSILGIRELRLAAQIIHPYLRALEPSAVFRSPSSPSTTTQPPPPSSVTITSHPTAAAVLDSTLLLNLSTPVVTLSKDRQDPTSNTTITSIFCLRSIQEAIAREFVSYLTHSSPGDHWKENSYMRDAIRAKGSLISDQQIVDSNEDIPPTHPEMAIQAHPLKQEPLAPKLSPMANGKQQQQEHVTRNKRKRNSSSTPQLSGTRPRRKRKRQPDDEELDEMGSDEMGSEEAAVSEEDVDERRPRRKRRMGGAGKKKKEKKTSTVKRPVNPYLIFLGTFLKDSKNAKIPHKEKVLKAGEVWRNMPEDLKSFYKAQAQQRKDQYNEAMNKQSAPKKKGNEKIEVKKQKEEPTRRHEEDDEEIDEELDEEEEEAHQQHLESFFHSESQPFKQAAEERASSQDELTLKQEESSQIEHTRQQQQQQQIVVVAYDEDDDDDP